MSPATSGGTTTTYIGRLEEVTTSGATTTTAYYGGVALSVNGALSHLLSDGLGSVTASVSASSGAVTATQLYSPYGSVRYTRVARCPPATATPASAPTPPPGWTTTTPATMTPSPGSSPAPIPRWPVG